MEEKQLQKTENKVSVKSLINSPNIKSKFEEMLGKKSASFLSSIVSAVSTNKILANCDPMSILSAASIAASLDLPINPSLGFAYIVPFKNLGQFQIGWKGFVQLALRSGQYKTINATPVFTGQIKKHNRFTGDIELNEDIEIADFTFRNQIGYLLYFKLMNGYEKYFYMTKEECNAHGKKYSQSFKKGYGLWVDDFESMALKTVVKLGLGKFGILSIQMQEAISSDQAVINEKGVAEYIDNDSENSSEETLDVANKFRTMCDTENSDLTNQK